MPNWFKIIEKAGEIINALRQPKDYISPRCLIDGLPMTLVPLSEPTFLKFPDGARVYRCPRGHEFSPGNYPITDPTQPPPPTDAGPTGEI